MTIFARPHTVFADKGIYVFCDVRLGDFSGSWIIDSKGQQFLSRSAEGLQSQRQELAMEALSSIPAPVFDILLAVFLSQDLKFLNLNTGSFWHKSKAIPLTPNGSGPLRLWQTPKELSELPGEIFELPTSLITSAGFDPQRQFTFCMSVVEFQNFGKKEQGVGRGLYWQKSNVMAHLEAWERYCGLTPPNPPVQFASFDQLRSQSIAAVDPRSLLLPLQRSKQNLYADDREIAWVKGFSHITQTSMLVPARAVYTDFAADSDWITGSSNGLAMGGTTQEALFYGLLELIERDAFLRTWYGLLPTEEMSTESMDHEITLVVDQLTRHGYRARFFRLDTGMALASVWCLLQNVEGNGPYSVSSSSCHPDPREAMFAALLEAAGTLGSMGRYFDPDRGRRLLLTHESVRVPVDHFQMYAAPEAAERLAFLCRGKPKTFDQVFPKEKSWPDRNNLEDCLVYTLTKLRKKVGDIVSVDLSLAVDDFPFRVAKVIVPGLLPMTHGYGDQRVPDEGIYSEQKFPHPFS